MVSLTQQLEYVHVLINHLPLTGLLIPIHHARRWAGFRLGLASRACARMNSGFRVIGVLLAATAVAVGETRTWTFEESGKTVHGEVIGFTGAAVTLRGADGKTFRSSSLT